MGEVDPQVLLNFELPAGMRVYAAQMHIKPLIKPSWQVQPIPPISNYPPVVEDLAFVVPEEVTNAQLLDAIRKAGGSLLTHVELFDIYRGKPIPDGHKSMAYKLTYESVGAAQRVAGGGGAQPHHPPRRRGGRRDAAGVKAAPCHTRPHPPWRKRLAPARGAATFPARPRGGN